MSKLNEFYDHSHPKNWEFENHETDYLFKRPIYKGSSGYGDLLHLHNGIILGRNCITDHQPHRLQ